MYSRWTRSARRLHAKSSLRLSRLNRVRRHSLPSMCKRGVELPRGQQSSRPHVRMERCCPAELARSQRPSKCFVLLLGRQSRGLFPPVPNSASLAVNDAGSPPLGTTPDTGGLAGCTENSCTAPRRADVCTTSDSWLGASSSLTHVLQ